MHSKQKLAETTLRLVLLALKLSPQHRHLKLEDLKDIRVSMVDMTKTNPPAVLAVVDMSLWELPTESLLMFPVEIVRNRPLQLVVDLNPGKGQPINHALAFNSNLELLTLDGRPLSVEESAIYEGITLPGWKMEGVQA